MEPINVASANPDVNQTELSQPREKYSSQPQAASVPSHETPAPSAHKQAGQAVIAQPLYFTANLLEENSDGATDELSKLVAHSSVIVIGTVSNSDPDVVRIPFGGTHTDMSSVGNVYDVEVERYLKGSGLDTLSVIQFIGVDQTISQSETRQAREKPENLLLGKGSRYLLFLREQDSSNDYWLGTAEPYKFLLSDGQTKVESPVAGMEEMFPNQAEFFFLNNIEGMITESP